ncbi:MAG: glycine--tRNA ligase [Candidatus Diapherotrites archaeon]
MPKEELFNLALRRQLYFPAAEIYAGAPAGFWDFGPVGVRIRNKVVDLWRKELLEKEGLLEIDGAVLLPKPVFEASGHLKSFNDPIVQCTKCRGLHRADQLIEEKTKEKIPESKPVEEMGKMLEENKIVCPKCKGALGEVRSFNMMMRVEIGATGDQTCFLRPETCQNIFLDFDRLYKTGRLNLPLGIAQAGKSFRNEIAPKQTLLREREIGQMEIEFFFNPKKINDFPRFEAVKDYTLNLQRLEKGFEKKTCAEAVDGKIVSGKIVAYWLARTQQFYAKLGIPVEKMRFRELEKDARAFYSAETWDFEVETDLGWIELVACNYRTDYDIAAHAKGSKKNLRVKEEGEEFTPHIFEVSAGIDRSLYVGLDCAFRKEKRGPEERIYLKLPPSVAPYLVAVFPLVNKDGVFEKGREVFEFLEDGGVNAFFDDKGSIGKRYARVDEIGVPFAITIDYDTLKDGTVTLRERDSMEQARLKVEQLPETLWALSAGRKSFNQLK